MNLIFYVLEMPTSFSIEFSDGYTFRKLIEYIKKMAKECIFILNSEGILINLCNEDKSVLNNLFIDQSELTMYDFQCSEKEHKIPLNIQHFLDIIKIGRKDALRIIKKEGQKQLFVAPMKEESSEINNYTMIMPLNIDEMNEIPYPKYSRQENNPNCTISISRFISGCSRMESVRPDHVKISMAPKGFIFSANKSTKDIGTIFKFGDSDDEFGFIRVVTKTIKNFKNLNGLSVNSTIKLIAEPGLPIKMICHVGCYAKLRIYVLNVDSK